MVDWWKLYNAGLVSCSIDHVSRRLHAMLFGHWSSSLLRIEAQSDYDGMYSEYSLGSDWIIQLLYTSCSELFSRNYNTFGLYFTTLEPWWLMRHLLKDVCVIMTSSPLFVGELALKNSIFDKIAKICDEPRKLWSTQKVQFLALYKFAWLCEIPVPTLVSHHTLSPVTVPGWQYCLLRKSTPSYLHVSPWGLHSSIYRACVPFQMCALCRPISVQKQSQVPVLVAKRKQALHIQIRPLGTTYLNIWAIFTTVD